MIHSESTPDLSAGELSEALGYTFLLLRPGGELIRWNRRLGEALGLTDEEIAAMQLSDLAPPTEQSRLEACLQEIQKTGSATTEIRLLSKSGQCLPPRTPHRPLKPSLSWASTSDMLSENCRCFSIRWIGTFATRG